MITQRSLHDPHLCRVHASAHDLERRERFVEPTEVRRGEQSIVSHVRAQRLTRVLTG